MCVQGYIIQVLRFSDTGGILPFSPEVFVGIDCREFSLALNSEAGNEPVRKGDSRGSWRRLAVACFLRLDAVNEVNLKPKQIRRRIVAMVTPRRREHRKLNHRGPPLGVGAGRLIDDQMIRDHRLHSFFVLPPLPHRVSGWILPISRRPFMIHASSPRKIEAPDTDATDVYAALEQAQRALSTAHANLKVDTIPVNVAEKRSDVLRLEISALKETFGAVVKERDAAFTEVAALKAEQEWDGVALTASVTEEREGLKREREALAKEREVQRTTFEAEKKALLDEREQIAQRLQDMSQLVRVHDAILTQLSPDLKIILRDCVPTAPESDAPTSGSTSPTALAAESPPSTSPKPIRHVRRTIESEISSGAYVTRLSSTPANEM
ncbi:hypothetical protein B0H11DRAFT_2210370 [Mycena galericulata]|nr:hypothetical protein B0H11DRAFT_2210370 [Mycena galericulata]